MTTSQKLNLKSNSWLNGFSLGIFILSIVGSGVFLFLFQNRIFPGVKIDGIEMGGLTTAQAQQLLLQKLPPPPLFTTTLVVDDIKLSSSSAQLGLKREVQTALAQAYEVGRVGFPLTRLWVLTQASFKPLEFQTQLHYQEETVSAFVREFAQLVNLTGQTPRAKLTHSGSLASLQIDPGKPGREVMLNDTTRAILNHANNSQNQVETQLITAQVASTSSTLDQAQLASAHQKASQLVGQRLILRADSIRLDLNDQKLISLLAFPQGFQQEVINALLQDWQDLVSRPAENAEFEFDEKTLTVGKFVPHRDGLELNQEETIKILTSTLEKLTEDELQNSTSDNTLQNLNLDSTQVGIDNQTNLEFQLPVNTTQPEITLEKTNNLGIKEKIGFGESEYDHSIPNRVFNVALTTNRVNDIIIAPGEEFSFNQALGEVSAKTGYKSAYVIKEGRTELGDGGGVCQVSTTLFRAVLDAGLEITRRLPHSYRVSYYELNSKPGIDATVYAGNTDFRFINDTKHHLLIHSEADSENLYMKIEIYGTSDGRTTEIKDHQVWGYTAPPPPEYYPDPSLPTGKKKQIDWAVGGVKAKFTHLIKNAAGEIISEKTYHSTYRPWSAKYLVGM